MGWSCLSLILIIIILLICNIMLINGENCEKKDLKKSNCEFKVICNGIRPTAINDVASCGSNADNVTFLVLNTVLRALTAGFFGSTNFDTMVRIIEAHDNDWYEISESGFRYYSKARILDLSRNTLKQIKNGAFKGMSSLEKLNLSSNLIDTLPAYSLTTTENQRDSKLYVLDISKNNLASSFAGPESQYLFHEIPNLKVLHFKNNQLIDVANIFDELKKLEELYLQHNNLNELHMAFKNLQNLKVLDVSHNEISKLMGFELNRLTSLEYFYVSHNRIESVESNCFNQAFSLRSIDLSFNRIKSPIETEMFINCNRLNYLNLQRNFISAVQDKSFKHNILEYLNLEYNNMTGELTRNIFTGLRKVSELNFFNQSIKSIRNNSFSELVALKYLNLSKNILTIIETDSFVGANALSILDLSFNTISNIKFLKALSENLTTLSLNNNNITVLEKYSLINLTGIVTLDISMNQIMYISQYSLPLSNLQKLNLTGNYLTGPLLSNVFSPAPFLRNLDLSNHNISSIEDNALTNMYLVARVNMSHNSIISVHKNNFNTMSNVYSLDLSFNKIDFLNLSQSNLPKLKGFYIKNNKLTSSTEIIPEVSSLTYLDISYNNISNLTDTAFKSTPLLKVLNLSNNRLKAFNHQQNNSLDCLVELNLATNQLTEINLSHYKDLIALDLSYNNFTNISSSMFENLDYLQALDISNNNIRELLPGTFGNFNILKVLNLSSNFIKSLRYGSLKGLHKAEVLDFSNNMITKLDVHIFHVCKELKKLIIDYNRIKTLDVEEIISIAPKLNNLSLGGNPISCKEIVTSIGRFNKNTGQLVVTSIDKVYHEDNVHGITCGDMRTNINDNVDPTSSKMYDLDGQRNLDNSNNSSSSITGIMLFICSSFFSIIAFVSILIMVFVYRKNRNIFSFNRDSARHLSSSVEMNTNYDF